MCNEDHLVENIACLIQNEGWIKFSSPVSIETAKEYRDRIPCSELVDDKTLAWMMSQASYMIYQATCWGVDWHEISKSE